MKIFSGSPALLLVFVVDVYCRFAVLPRLRVNAAGQEGVFQRSVDERLRGVDRHWRVAVADPRGSFA
jgi:hypothetical protein